MSAEMEVILVSLEEYQRLQAAAEALAEIVRRAIPAEHHHLCDSRHGGECDCYMRRYADERAAVALYDEALAGLGAKLPEAPEVLGDSWPKGGLPHGEHPYDSGIYSPPEPESARLQAAAAALEAARRELDAWRRYAQMRRMGAEKTAVALIAQIDEALEGLRDQGDET